MPKTAWSVIYENINHTDFVIMKSCEDNNTGWRRSAWWLIPPLSQEWKWAIKLFHPGRELNPLSAELQRFFQLGPLISLQVICESPGLWWEIPFLSYFLGRDNGEYKTSVADQGQIIFSPWWETEERKRGRGRGNVGGTGRLGRETVCFSLTQ